MAARNPLESSPAGLPPDTSWPEALAEYTYQLLRRLGPEAMSGLQTPPTTPPTDSGPIEDETSLAAAPAWVREAFARAKEGAQEELSDAGARSYIARDRLLLALRRRHMSQADLARQLHKSPTSISRIFKAPHRSRLTTLQAIADALDVELSDLFEPEARPGRQSAR
jgi:DNA-binding Xre family transcriptional regulator